MTAPPESLAALAARHGPRYRWRVLMTVMIGSIASVMSSTIVIVAVPDLMRHFAIGQERAQWVATAFMAAMTLSMLPTPWLLSRFGYRHTYVGAVALLMLGGIVGGLARHYELVLAMLADAASPVALFAIGAVLWRSGQHLANRTPVADVLPVALIKLLLHPLLVLLASTAARQLGAPITAFHITVMTLAAALPSASNVSLLTERYGADSGRIARIIMTSTALAFVTFSALAWAFGVQPG